MTNTPDTFEPDEDAAEELARVRGTILPPGLAKLSVPLFYEDMKPAQTASEALPPASAHWLQLASGARFALDGPVSPLAIEDVAAALAKICRFGGATTEFYSVAQHSVLVHDLSLQQIGRSHDKFARAVLRKALLHDAHEMVLADIVRPTKWWMSAQNGRFGEHLDAAEEAIDARIFAGLGQIKIGEPGVHYPAIIKRADNIALAIERRDLMVATGDVWHGIPTADEIAVHPVIQPLDWRRARDLFIARWVEVVA